MECDTTRRKKVSTPQEISTRREWKKVKKKKQSVTHRMKENFFTSFLMISHAKVSNLWIPISKALH